MLKMMAPSTTKVNMITLPEGKHPVGTGEILDKTTVDPEEENCRSSESSDGDSSA